MDMNRLKYPPFTEGHCRDAGIQSGTSQWKLGNSGVGADGDLRILFASRGNGSVGASDQDNAGHAGGGRGRHHVTRRIHSIRRNVAMAVRWW